MIFLENRIELGGGVLSVSMHVKDLSIEKEKIS